MNYYYKCTFGHKSINGKYWSFGDTIPSDLYNKLPWGEKVHWVLISDDSDDEDSTNLMSGSDSTSLLDSDTNDTSDSGFDFGGGDTDGGGADGGW